MTLKHVLKHFSKTEVQEDERFPLAPMREREELLCERSELSNSGEGCISCAEHTVTVFSPFTSHFSQLCLPSPDATRHPLPGEGKFVIQNNKTHPTPPLEKEGVSISCAEHTVTVFSPFTSHFSQLCLPSPDATRHPLPREGNKVSCAEHTEKNLFSYSPIHLFTFKKCAFTLAEVLITLAIIGVVAAMTMPSLIQNHQKRSLEVATQRFYSMMSQAVKQYMADEGVDDLRNTPLGSGNYDELCESPEAIESIRNFVTKYLKVVEECDHDANNCFASKYNAWHGGEIVYDMNFTDDANWDSRRDYVLADGSIIRIGYESNSRPIVLYVDVNGKKGPNRVGYDLWSMSIFYDGVIDESGVFPEVRRGETDWTPQGERQWRFEDVCQVGSYGGCFGHFLENNFKFDY